MDKSQFGATNTAYLPPPPDASITAKTKMKPLDRKTLAVLAKKFADQVPEEEFSVAGLQGCEFFIFIFHFIFILFSFFIFYFIFLGGVTFFGMFIDYMILLIDLLKHKAQPEAAANGVESWVKSEREMRERLQREKDAREVREQALVSFLSLSLSFFSLYILIIIIKSSEKNVKRKHRRRLLPRKRKIRRIKSWRKSRRCWLRKKRRKSWRR